MSFVVSLATKAIAVRMVCGLGRTQFLLQGKSGRSETLCAWRVDLMLFMFCLVVVFYPSCVRPDSRFVCMLTCCSSPLFLPPSYFLYLLHGGFYSFCDHGKHRNAKLYNSGCNLLFRGETRITPKTVPFSNNNSLHNFITQTK